MNSCVLCKRVELHIYLEGAVPPSFIWLNCQCSGKHVPRILIDVFSFIYLIKKISFHLPIGTE